MRKKLKLFPLVLEKICFQRVVVNIIEYEPNIKATIILIIVVGNKYINPASNPLYSYIMKKEETEKPIMKPFIYIKKMLAIIPTIDMPSIQISIIKRRFWIIELLNACPLLILLVLIFEKKFVIWFVTNSLSVSFRTNKKMVPETIPKIIINNTNKFILLWGRIIDKILLTFLFIILSPIKYIKIYWKYSIFLV